MEVAARDHDPASHNIQVDQFPPIKKILQKEISLRNTNGAIYRLDVLSPNTGGEFPTVLHSCDWTATALKVCLTALYRFSKQADPNYPQKIQ